MLKTAWRYDHFMHLDKPLLLGLLSLSMIGLIVLYSAGGQNMDVVLGQASRMAMGFTVMFLIAQLHPHYIARWVPWIYAAGVILLILVLVMGNISKGAQRWLNLGLFRFQPSEMMKLAVPMMVTWFLAHRSLPPSPLRLFVAILIALVPMLLIAKQPDLGTALLVGSAGMFVIFFAGIPWKVIFGAGALLAGAAPVFWYLLHDYQRKRILVFLDPESEPLGAGYHIVQSKIAVGSGGFYGKGWLNGTQSHLEFLPESTTDFIFAVFNEEFGMLGVLLLLSIYIFILTRGMYIAMQAQGTFARLLSSSLVTTLFVYIFVNMGMVIGLLPVVGVPLPLISYGGTSLVTLMANFGLLMGIHTHRRLLSN